MFEKLNSLFNRSGEKAASVELAKSKSAETKKCKKCLRRVDLNYESCPHCRSRDFQFNDG